MLAIHILLSEKSAANAAFFAMIAGALPPVAFLIMIARQNRRMRLFAAIPAPLETHESIAKAAQALDGCLGVKVLPRDNYHITLKFLGDVEQETAQDVIAALHTVSFAPFRVKLAGAGAYPNMHFPRAIFIAGKSSEAEQLAEKVEAALAPFKFHKDGNAFSVHLTVGRAKTVGDIKEFLQKTGDVCEFEVRKFVLMKSRLLPSGASYEVLREFAAKA